MCVYRDAQFDLLSKSTRPGPRRCCRPPTKLAHRYSTASAQPLSHWDNVMALAYFKSTIIAAGIDFRSRMGGSDDTVDQVGEAVAPPIAAGFSRMKA
jgi:aminoglycoside phosphotransferase (APT) family kinase protein